MSARKKVYRVARIKIPEMRIKTNIGLGVCAHCPGPRKMIIKVSRFVQIAQEKSLDRTAAQAVV